ncbi:MAG: hypothetical protein J6Z45_03455 [Oscillospiraceae bacterium]|nr:hypothetical protein [Oscillospiraceae bacterium]
MPEISPAVSPENSQTAENPAFVASCRKIKRFCRFAAAAFPCPVSFRQSAAKHSPIFVENADKPHRFCGLFRYLRPFFVISGYCIFKEKGV